jgi:hypothetical protein
VLVAPVIVWTAVEMVRAWRERRAIKRWQKRTYGDGMP